MAITFGLDATPRGGNFMLGADDQGGQEGGGPKSSLIVCFYSR